MNGCVIFFSIMGAGHFLLAHAELRRGQLARGSGLYVFAGLTYGQ